MRSAKLLILVLCIISCQQNDKSEIESYENEISKLNSVIAEKEEKLSALNQLLIQKEDIIGDLVDSLKGLKNGKTENKQVGLNLNAFEQLLEAQVHLNESSWHSQFYLTSYEFLSPNLVSAQYSDGHSYTEKKLNLRLINNSIEISPDGKNINPREILEQNHNIKEFINDSSAYYYSRDWSVEEVRFKGVRYYGSNKAIGLFSYSNPGAYCHACAGWLGLAKLEKLNGDWKLLSFTKDCECGNGDYGSANLPDIINIGDHFFLIEDDLRGGMGFISTTTTLYDITTYRPVLTFISDESINLGEMTEYKATDKSTLSLSLSNNRIKATITYQATSFSKGLEGFIDNSRIEVYFYDEISKEFVKYNY
ncbi:hypothetical protein ACV07N_13300 [Roseivirga echinicomitans]